MVVVVREADRGVVQRHLTGHEVVVPGGDTRHGSEWNALQALAPRIDAGEIDVVAIHDSARPLASPDLFRAVVEAAASYGGALPVREQPALVPRDGGPRPMHPVAVQTPQAFRARPLLDAYRRPSGTASSAPTPRAAWSGTPTSPSTASRARRPT